ncbi:MAG: hypothetical protein M1436_08080 [Acidobacteria bacterium]|nr:hypothetical protein [Acidobacteriota bacterium]
MRGDICTVCCGTEREVTVDCPFDCIYLQDARQHERLTPLTPDEMPNREIKVTEGFLREHEELLVHLARALAASALEVPGIIDYDVREALDALIRTYRTLESGVYYESRPNNPLAGRIFAGVQQAAAEYQRQERERLGMSRTRDADIMGVLAFLQRLELDRNNGRKRGRAFVDFLRSQFSAATVPPAASPLIVP